MVEDLVIKIFGNRHIYYYLMHPLRQSISLWVFIVVKTGLISKSFSKGAKSSFKLRSFVKHDLRGRGYVNIHVLLKTG